MTYRRVLLAGFCSALLLGMAWGCAAADDSGTSLSGGGGDKGIPDSGNDEKVLTADGSSTDADGAIVLNRLCGKHPTCVPDFPPNTCESFSPPAVPNDDASPGADASESSQAGASGEGGASGAGAVSGSAEGGTSGAENEAGASGAQPAAGASAGGASGEGGGAGASPVDSATYGCQVQRTADDPKLVTSQCAVVGPGGDNAPCLTSADCKAGFGCVGDQNSGKCQAYCCESADNCKQGKYCADRALRDAVINALPKGSSDISKTLSIPVCVPAENCDLGAPYPCTTGTQCACEAGTACLVVRSDGTTTCAVPGAGKVGDPCPCAWGHVCSAATNQCLQLCYTPSAPSCGDGGRCQSASELPDGWGVCVGATPSGG
jgi:hypothetical protein